MRGRPVPAQHGQVRRLLGAVLVAAGLLSTSCTTDESSPTTTAAPASTTTAPSSTNPSEAAAGPDGEILAATVDAAEIHRFSTTGEDLGALTLPDEVEPPLRNLTISHDGQKLAFISGGANRALWVHDLESGATASTTPPTCADWSDDNQSLWALVDTPPNEYVARVDLDDTFDRLSVLDVVGCPYRFDSTSLLMASTPTEGAPSQIDRVQIDDGTIEPLLVSPCNLAHPQVSPDGRQVLVTAGCPDDAESGVYLASSDGTEFRQVTTGPAAAPTWSPAGGRFTFAASDADGQLQVMITDLDGSTTEPITPPGYSWPTWVKG